MQKLMDEVVGICISTKKKSNLKKHVTLAHEGPKLFQCKVFHDDFPHKCLLKKHIKSVHRKSFIMNVVIKASHKKETLNIRNKNALKL